MTPRQFFALLDQRHDDIVRAEWGPALIVSALLHGQVDPRALMPAMDFRAPGSTSHPVAVTPLREKTLTDEELKAKAMSIHAKLKAAGIGRKR